MSLPQLLRNLTLVALVATLPRVCPAAAVNLARVGGETLPFGSAVGEQLRPHVSLAVPGGFMGAYAVWEDSRTGTNHHIYSGEFYSDLSADPLPFDVSGNRSQHQEKPRVAMLAEAGAAYVWQQGQPGYQHIYASFFDPFWGFSALDVMVNQSASTYQENPDVAGLAGGDVAVVWSSLNQEYADSGRGIFGRLFASAGGALGGEFQINQYTPHDQRDPAIAALADGGMVVVWVSEQQRMEASLLAGGASLQPGSIDIFGRRFSASGLPVGEEFLVNTGTNLCAFPRVAAGMDGGFMVVWAEKDRLETGNGWEAIARPYDRSGVAGVANRVNTQRRLDHLLPQVSAVGANYLVVWVSIGQGGSQEAVYGQMVQSSGQLSGSEFRINAGTRARHTQPSVATDGNGQTMVVWSGYTLGAASMDVNSQIFVLPQLPALNAPVVTDSGVNKLVVSWQPPVGLEAAYYQVFLDGASLPSAVVTNSAYWAMKGLLPGESHTFQVAYVLAGGQRSPLSAATTGATGVDANGDGISDAWQALYWGPNPANWPSALADSNGNGLSNYAKFLAGLNPLNRNSLLRVGLRPVSDGYLLEWNSVLGKLYRVQTRSNLTTPWAEVGATCCGGDGISSLGVSPSGAGFYRVVLVP